MVDPEVNRYEGERMKKVMVVLMMVLILLVTAGPAWASDGSDDSSSDSGSSDDSSDDSSSDSSSSDDSSDDSSSGSSSSDDSSDDSSSGSSSSDGGRDDLGDDRYDDSISRTEGSGEDILSGSAGSMDENGSADDLSGEVERVRESASEREVELERELERYSGETLTQMAEDKDLRVALYTIHEAGSITGAGSDAPQLVTIADEIQRVADDSLRQEERIRDRSSIVRFFAGGDTEAATSLERNADQVQARISELETLLASEEIDGAIKPIVRETVQELVTERDHLLEMARIEREDRGLFDGIFGS